MKLKMIKFNKYTVYKYFNGVIISSIMMNQNTCTVYSRYWITVKFELLSKCQTVCSIAINAAIYGLSINCSISRR